MDREEYVFSQLTPNVFGMNTASYQWIPENFPGANAVEREADYWADILRGLEFLELYLMSWTPP